MTQLYLKALEIQGFKSFPDKTVLNFGEDITAIVGPNGSGKSNISDAIRWVMGEQSSKSLRGMKMEDVIFSGTQLRKPQGSAYVAITLDNSDHSLPIDYGEVTVARRVYRSGESEYLINGTVSRLKDVYSLFFDTGIGKEGYSIIGQGQVEKIISGKPEERRELFEVPRDALGKLVREHYLRVAGVEGEPYALTVEPAAQLLGLVGKLAALVEVAEHFEALQLLRRQESLLEAVVPRQNEPAQLLHGLSGSTVISAAVAYPSRAYREIKSRQRMVLLARAAERIPDVVAENGIRIKAHVAVYP